MSEMSYRNYLGMYFGQKELVELFTAFNIAPPSKLKMSDYAAYLSSPAMGVELTFFDAESRGFSNDRIPDGAQVLANIRFYGVKTDTFQPFSGELPDGMFFGEKRSALVNRMGPPDWINAMDDKLRWENETSSILATMDDHDKVEVVSLQLKTD